MRTLLFEAGADLLPRRAVDARVSHLLFPFGQKQVLRPERRKAPPFERIAAHVADAAFDLSLVLRRVRPARQHIHRVMTAKLRQLRIDLRIEPIRLQDRRFEVVQVHQQRRPAKAAHGILQTTQKRLRVLPQHRLAIGLARVAQHHAKHPTAPRLAGSNFNRRAQAEIHLHLLSRLTFHPPDPPGLARLELLHIALHRLVGTGKAAFPAQILIDALGAQARFQLARDQRFIPGALALPAHRQRRFAHRLLPGLLFHWPLARRPVPGDRNGALCLFLHCNSRAEGRNGAF